jgi:nicotinic acid mononucleotide adenylyltransferase
MKNQNFHCVTVCRSHENDILRSNLSSKWNGSIHVVEDNAILDASLDMITSRKVRDKIKNGDNVEQLVGAKINEYISIHRLGPKVIFVIIIILLL